MEEEVAELRRQLKAARNDVKRYASYALRLQQELAREKQKGADALDEEDALSDSYAEPAGSAWDRRVEKAGKEHDVWRRRIERAVQVLDGGRGDPEDRDAKRGNQAPEQVDAVLQRLVPFLQQQQRLVGELGRENAKLRDTLHARPTRRELATCRLEVERLQRHVRKLRVRATTAELHEPTGASERVLVKEASLSERILEQRVLQMLRVNTEDAAAQHQYLQEKLHCYLSLDASRLTATQPHLAEAGILERVGRICSDVVASCCYVLEVEEVGELPRCVGKTRQLAHVSTTYQDFLERLEKLLKRFDKDAFYAIRAESSASTSCKAALDMVLTHVNDVLVELDARREQMKPPGSTAHQVLLQNMKILRVARLDQLAPTVRRLVDNMRAEQEFQRALRELLGLDEAANRSHILHVASVLFGELGFLTGTAPLGQGSAA